MNTLYGDIIRSGEARNKWYRSGLAYVYLLRVKHYRHKDNRQVDEFIKIGFTHQPDVRDRIATFPKCYRVEIVDTIMMDEATAYKLEQFLHQNLRDQRYLPMYKKWGGVTECYNKRLLNRFPTLFDLIYNIVERQLEYARTSPFCRL